MATIAIIGFGEAGRGFAAAGGWARATAFDTAVDAPPFGGARRCETLGETLAEATLVLSLVTADQAFAAAIAAAPHLRQAALWCDMNSVAPGTKRRAADAIARAGARYVDVAIMAPVHPALLAVPLLLAGPDAAAGDGALANVGFGNRRIVGDAIGDASAVKMLRSVIVKGQEALTAEALHGAARAGLVDELLAALGPEWPARADYNLDRMLVHGARRAAEMDEVAATLVELGIDPVMSRGTAGWQRRLGAGVAPAGLVAKLGAIA